LNSRAENGAETSDAGNPVLASGLTPESVVASAFPDLWGLGVRETILLVEDEAFVRNALAEALESAGYRTMIADNAIDALKACRNENVDLLLTDVVLPGMNGCELVEKFRKLFPHASILLMSGYGELLRLKELFSDPLEYLAKPFSIPILLERVRKVLNARERTPV
jgi:DNA-binding NtrC family response regulator